MQEMPLLALPEVVLYQGQGDKGEVLPSPHYKERYFC